MAGLEISNVTKKYTNFRAVDDVSISIKRGEFLTLLGPSGSGKTTLLMMIAGFVQADRGDLTLNGQTITHLPPEARNLGMVFQGYALFPHLSVFDNVAFPLKVRKQSREEIATKVRAALDLVQLTALADRLPRQLSGGQQQRVALARALVFQPHLLLLDEPLSALDKKLRAELQDELKRLHRKVGLGFIYVTHDQEEALSMSDRIAVMRSGKIVEHGTPTDLYERPNTAFVADFIGKSNFVSGSVVEHRDGGFVFSGGGVRFVQRTKGPAPAIGASVSIALRPEKIGVLRSGETAENELAGTLTEWNYLGSEFRLVVDAGPFGSFSVSVPTWQSDLAPEIGAAMKLGWSAAAGMVVAQD